MKSIRLIFVVGMIHLILMPALAQESNLAEDWKAFEQRNKQISKRGMISLGSWGLANMVSGSIAAPITEGAQRNFHLMNLSWGAVNFAIALPSLISYMKKKEVETDPLQISKSFRSSKTVYLLNAGLDVGYTLSGLWMYERSKRIAKPERAEMIKGFGYSVMLQGIYLLTYDAVMYGIYASRNKKQDELMKRSLVKF
ncbi:MAG: hypothetical protein WD048_05755 [Chitinophagales bacterium]